MKAKSIIPSIVLSLVLVVGLCPISAFAGSGADLQGAKLSTQATNPYPKWQTIDGKTTVRCTYFAWQQAYDKLGIALPGWSHGYTWYNSARNAGYSVGTSPRANSIAVWSGNTYGHVAFVTAVNGNSMTVNEGGWTGSGGTSEGIRYGGTYSSVAGSRTSWGLTLTGFIYLQGNPDPDPGDRVRISAGKYIIQSKIGNRVIDIDAGSDSNNANAQLWEPLGSSGQTFSVGHNDDLDAEYFQPCCSYKFLDAEGGAVPTNVSQYDGTGGGNQNWVLKDAGDGYVYIRNLAYGYLDVSGGEDRNGANVWVCGYNGSDAQKWRLIPVSGNSKQSVPSGTCVLRSKIGGKLLDVSGGGKDNGANVQIWQPNGTTNQIFEINQNSAGAACSIKIPASGKVLDTAGDANGSSNVQQWEGIGSWGQSWFFEDAGDGYVYICNRWGRYLDVSGGSDQNGSNAWVCGYNGSDAQKWKVMRVSGQAKTTIPDGTYYMQSKIGGRCLDIEGARNDSGANARLWAANTSQSQVFNVGWFSALEANYIQLESSGLFLDAAGGDGRVNLWQWEGNGGWGQNWFFEDAGDGWYYVRNLYSYYVDVDAGVDANGANVQAWDFVGSDGQKWKLVPQSIPEDRARADAPSATVTGVSSKTLTGKDDEPQISGETPEQEGTTGGAPEPGASEAASVPDAAPTGTTMYRLYNPYSGEHFYTSDAGERAGLVELGWTDEGEGWRAPEASDTPVYRMYNPYVGDHHYTLDPAERDALVDVGWLYEGVGWYSDDEQRVPLYREYNPNEPACNHNYTTSKEEHDTLVSIGWVDEGIAWYGV